MNVLFRNTFRAIRRAVGLSPMRRLLRVLRRRGVELSSLDALELFGGTGLFHTLDYATRVRSLEVWEIDPLNVQSLRKNLPHATVRNVDTYIAVRERGRTFNLIVVDNPMSTWDRHCEHFDLLPDVFGLLNDRALVVLNVIPMLTPKARKRFSYVFNRDQLDWRRRFYRTETPEAIPISKMVSVYDDRFREGGYEILWHESVRRHFVHYLVFSARRRPEHLPA